MDDKIIGFWKSNKILFFLLLPVLLILLFWNIIMEFLIGSARKMTEEGKKTDAALKASEDQTNAQANQLKAESDALETKIANEKVDENWNKK